MKQTNAKEVVIKASMKDHYVLDGKNLPKTLMDGPSSVVGLKMQLHPAGLECFHAGRRFIIPYANCGTISLVPEKATKDEAKEDES